jgi:glutaredoxin
MIAVLVAGLAIGAAAADEPTIYKTIGPDGHVVYSDRQPGDGKLQETRAPLTRPAGESTPLTNATAPLATRPPRVETSPSPVAQVAATLGSGKPVLFVDATCTECRRAQLWLMAHQVDYRLVDVATPSGRADYTAAGGRGALPLLLRGGRRVQGWSDRAYEELFGLR